MPWCLLSGLFTHLYFTHAIALLCALKGRSAIRIPDGTARVALRNGASRSFTGIESSRRLLHHFARRCVRVSHPVVIACWSMAVQFFQLLRYIVFHVDHLDASHSIEGRKPEELLFLVTSEEKKLAILRLQGKRVLPITGDRIFVCVTMKLHRVDVEELSEGNLLLFARHLVFLDYEALLFEVDREEPLVV